MAWPSDRHSVINMLKPKVTPITSQPTAHAGDRQPGDQWQRGTWLNMRIVQERP
jgi:hypothetical protein